MCRYCDTHGLPGAGQYMGETGVISKACQSISLGCQAQRHSATHSSWRFETATLCCTESLEDGAGTVRSRQCEAASCTWSNEAASSETGGRRGRSLTAYKKGALPVPKGGHNQRLLGALEQKKSSHGCTGRTQWQHHADPAGNGPDLTVQHGSGTAALRGLASMWAHVWTLYIAPTDSPHRLHTEHGSTVLTGPLLSQGPGIIHIVSSWGRNNCGARGWCCMQRGRLFSGLVQRGGNAVNTASLQA